MPGPVTDTPLLAILRHLEAALMHTPLTRPVTIIDTLSAPGGGLDTLQEENERLKIGFEYLQKTIDIYESKIEAFIESVEAKMTEMNAYADDLITRAQDTATVDTLPEQKDARDRVENLADEYVLLVTKTQNEYTMYDKWLQSTLETFDGFFDDLGKLPEGITQDDIELMKQRKTFVAREITIMSPQIATQKTASILLRVSAVYVSLQTKRESSQTVITEADRLGKALDEKYNELKKFLQNIYAGPKPESHDAILERFSQLKDDLLKQGAETEAGYIKVIMDRTVSNKITQLYLNKRFDVSKQHLMTVMNDWLKELQDFLAEPVEEKDSVEEKDPVEEKNYIEEQSSLITEVLEKKDELIRFVQTFDKDKTTQSKADTLKQFNRMYNIIMDIKKRIYDLNKIIRSSEKYRGKSNSKFVDFVRSERNINLFDLNDELRRRLGPDSSVSAVGLKDQETKKNLIDQKFDDAIAEFKSYAQYLVDGIDNEWRDGPQPERKAVAEKFKDLLGNIVRINASAQNSQYIKTLCDLLPSTPNETLKDTASKIKQTTDRIEYISNIIRFSLYLNISLQHIISKDVALKIEHFMLAKNTVSKFHEEFEQKHAKQQDLHLEKDTDDLMRIYMHKIDTWKKQYLEFVDKKVTQFIHALDDFEHNSDSLKDELQEIIPTLIRKIQASENITAQKRDEMVGQIHSDKLLLSTDIINLIQQVNREYREDEKDQKIHDEQLILTSEEREPVTHTIHPTQAFAPYIAAFANKLSSLAFPPTPTEPWHANTTQKQNTKTPQTHTKRTHAPPSPFLSILCARVAHIAVVAESHDTLAALRFALEITPTSPLVARALAPAPSAALEHPAINALRACFCDASLRQLHSFARPPRPPRLPPSTKTTDDETSGNLVSI